MKAFWAFLLRRDLPRDALSDVGVAVFGHGDSRLGAGSAWVCVTSACRIITAHVAPPPPRLARLCSYAKFNAVARMLHTRLQQLGAVELCPRGLGDEQGTFGVEGDLDDWLSTLWPAVLARWPNPDGVVVSDVPVLQPPLVSVAVCPSAPALGCGSSAADAGTHRLLGSALAECLPCPVGASTPCIAAGVRSNERLTAPGWQQDVRSVVLDIGPSGQR